MRFLKTFGMVLLLFIAIVILFFLTLGYICLVVSLGNYITDVFGLWDWFPMLFFLLVSLAIISYFVSKMKEEE